MKLKFILASMLLAGSAFTGFADGYLDGVEYYQAGQEDNAEIVLNETLNDAQTDKAVAHYYLGSIALHKGNLAEAEKHFDAGIQANPEYAFNYVGKGAVALKNNNKDAAKDFFKQAEKADKKDAKVKVDIARSYYMTDSILYKKEFNDFLKKAKKSNKEEASIYIFEGDIYADQKDYGKSAGYYEMAIRYDIDRPIAYVKYANTYFHLAPDVAIAKLKEIVDKNPNSALAQRELAEKYYENNQWTMAAEQYKNVVDNPNHFPSDEARYVVLLYFGERYDESLTIARQMLASNHSPFLMKRMIFLNLAAMENYQEAEASANTFFAAPQSESNHFTANDYTTYGNVLMSLDKDLDAVAAFENALKVNPKKTELLKEISAAYTAAAAADNKNPEYYVKAAEAYQKFIDANEYNNGYDLNDLFILTGRYQNAIATLQDSVLRQEVYNKAIAVADTVISKAEKDYRVVQRKARIIRIFNGETVRTQEAVDAYLKTVEIAESDADLTEDKKNSILSEAYLYIGTFYLIEKKDTPMAKEYFEKAYAINPNPQMREYIGGLK